jgi:hypothetical protein
MIPNSSVRNAATRRGVKLWQVAHELGMHESSFSRKLRFELSEEEQVRIVGVINHIADVREGVC